MPRSLRPASDCTIMTFPALPPKRTREVHLDPAALTAAPASRPEGLPAAPPPPPPCHRSGRVEPMRPPCTEVRRERTVHRRGDVRPAGSEELAGVRAKPPRGLRGRCAPKPRRRSVPLRASCGPEGPRQVGAGGNPALPQTAPEGALDREPLDPPSASAVPTPRGRSLDDRRKLSPSGAESALSHRRRGASRWDRLSRRPPTLKVFF